MQSEAKSHSEVRRSRMISDKEEESTISPVQPVSTLEILKPLARVI